MFEATNFVMMQVQRLKKAMQQPELADFRPDGKGLADVVNLLTQLEAAKGDATAKQVSLRTARGGLATVHADAHDKCVNAYAAMRSVYRRDGTNLLAMRRIPKRDQTARQTLVRMEVTGMVWSQLPVMPGTPDPFQCGPVTLAGFNAVAADLRARIETCEGCDAALEVAQGTLAALVVELSNFASAAVAQGRSQYALGSPARAWIETIPLEPSTDLPDQAVILEATSPAPGAVHLAFEAARATSFTIKHKAPGTAEFVMLAEDVTERTFDAVGQPVGEHQYVVIGHNSRGDGAPSAVATLAVALVVAA
jgi:hypothetical protein